MGEEVDEADLGAGTAGAGGVARRLRVDQGLEAGPVESLDQGPPEVDQREVDEGQAHPLLP
jgi:hypothetical protein